MNEEKSKSVSLSSALFRAIHFWFKKECCWQLGAAANVVSNQWSTEWSKGGVDVQIINSSNSILGVLDHVDLCLQIENQITEVEWVHVFAEQIKEEPVTDATLFEHFLNSLRIGDAAVGVSGDDTHARVEDGHCSVNECKCAHDGQEVEPEPEEDVHLLVDNVDGQNAHGVVTLYIT